MIITSLSGSCSKGVASGIFNELKLDFIVTNKHIIIDCTDGDDWALTMRFSTDEATYPSPSGHTCCGQYRCAKPVTA